jgi:hypothetical protein
VTAAKLCVRFRDVLVTPCAVHLGVGKRKGGRGGRNPYLLSWSTARPAISKSRAAVDLLLCSRTTTSASTVQGAFSGCFVSGSLMMSGSGSVRIAFLCPGRSQHWFRFWTPKLLYSVLAMRVLQTLCHCTFPLIQLLISHFVNTHLNRW